MGLREEIERVAALVDQGTDEQREWFATWQARFSEAEAAGDAELRENLADILIVYERSELRPPERYYTLEELIDLLEVAQADFRRGGTEGCDDGEHAPPVPSPGEDGFVHHVCPKCGQTLLVESLRQAAERERRRRSEGRDQ